MSIFTSDIPMLFQQNPVSALLLCAVILLVAALVLGFIYFQLFPKHKIYYGSLVAFTMGVIFFGGTFLCCYMAFDLYSNSREAAASNSWPAAPGTVRRTWVYRIKELGSKTNTYHVGADYNYSVNGVPYTSSRTSAGGEFAPDLGEKFYSSAGAEEQARKLVNSRVKVYYDPGHPERAVLYPGGTGPIFQIILYFLFSLCVLLPLGLTMFRAVRRPVPQGGVSQPGEGKVVKP